MRRVVFAASLVALLAGAILLGGCGGAGSTSQPREGKIEEFVGRGFTGEKPGGWSLTAAPGEPKVIAPELRLNGMPVIGHVPPGQVTWYRLPVVTAARLVLVTLQQWPNADSDLYVLRSAPYFTNPVIGFSNRFASGLPDLTSIGVPDWVCATYPASTGPAAQTAVYGTSLPATDKAFRLEADTVTTLKAGGAFVHSTVPLSSSRWYRFKGAPGVSFQLVVTAAVASDPDVYIYDTDANGFVKKSDGIGGENVQLTTANDHWYYVRVMGYGSANVNYYDIQLFRN